MRKTSVRVLAAQLISELSWGYAQIDGYKECDGQGTFYFGITKILTRDEAQLNCRSGFQESSLVHEENGKNWGCTNQFDVKECTISEFEEGTELRTKFWLGTCVGQYTNKSRR